MSPRITELKNIADGLAAIGKPGNDDCRKASMRLALMERFARLVEASTVAERKDLVITLRSMLSEVAR